MKKKDAPIMGSAVPWDDGVIDPSNKRSPALGLEASLNTEIEETRFGVFLNVENLRRFEYEQFILVG